MAILGAAALGLPFYLLRLPLLLAYIAAGVALGPHLGFGLITSAEAISVLSEIGLVLLMFILGLEIDLRKLMQAGKAVLINGLTQFLFCALLGAAFFYLLGFRNGGGSYDLTYLSIACALSSTLVVVKILSDRLELDSLTSRITLGILVIQDLWAIGFLAIQPNLASLQASRLLGSLSNVLILVGISWLMARFVLPWVFKRSGRAPELMLIMAMSWCFAMVGLAGALHLSPEMGALVAGVSIASFPYQTDVASKVSSLRDFFITLFFVALGLRIPMPNAEMLKLAAAVFVFVNLSRIATVFPVLYWMRYGNRASLVPALNLSQVSEFSLVLSALGASYGHVGGNLLAAFILALVATALLSSAVIPNGHSAYRLLNPLLERLGFKDRVAHAAQAAGQEHGASSIVLLGFFREASSLLHAMLHKHSAATLKNLMVVDFNPEAHHKLRELGVRCEYGDISHADTLKHLHLENAKILVCSIPDHLLKGTSNLKLLKTLRAMAPSARIVVTAETLDSARSMYHEGADYVFLPRVISAHYLTDVLDRIAAGGGNVIKEKAAEYIGKRHEVLA